jgi:hypothetical protein
MKVLVSSDSAWFPLQILFEDLGHRLSFLWSRVKVVFDALIGRLAAFVSFLTSLKLSVHWV